MLQLSRRSAALLKAPERVRSETKFGLAFQALACCCYYGELVGATQKKIPKATRPAVWPTVSSNIVLENKSDGWYGVSQVQRSKIFEFEGLSFSICISRYLREVIQG